MKTHENLLEIENLSIGYQTSHAFIPAVNNISIAVRPGEFTAVVGESGSGKTTLIRGILGLLRTNARITVARLRLMGQEVTPAQMQEKLGGSVGFVPQNPMAALNPLRRIGSQIEEVFKLKTTMTAREIRRRCRHLMQRVRLDDSERIYASYPHQLSGGMAQRVVLGMALAMSPPLFVADEPTSSLDASLRKDLLEMIRSLCAEGMGVLFVTHDLHLVESYADSLLVMKQGAMVENGDSRRIFANPAHHYTQTLLQCRCCL